MHQAEGLVCALRLQQERPVSTGWGGGSGRGQSSRSGGSGMGAATLISRAVVTQKGVKQEGDIGVDCAKTT